MNRFANSRHNSFVYHFIDLFIQKTNLKSKKIESLLFQSILLSNAPYEKEVLDGIKSISEEVDIAQDIIRLTKKAEAPISNKELLNLYDKMSGQKGI